MSIKQNITRVVGRKVLQAKKNSPHIFFAAGVVGVVGGTVLACKATLKLEDTLDDIQKEVNFVKLTEAVAMTDQERNRLLALKYARGGVKLAKLYAPALVVGTISIGLLAGSHIQLTRRNSALSATLALMTKSFDDYRERVRAEIGDVKEGELYHGIEVDKNGAKLLGEEFLSPYARCFSSQTTAEWHPNAELNRNFVQCYQNYANHMLHVRGHVMLNDVYDMLGLERSTAGAVVGWVLGSDKDNFIDFGMFTKKDNIPFMLGDEFDIWLDFNVDGEVFRLIDQVSGAGS